MNMHAPICPMPYMFRAKAPADSVIRRKHIGLAQLLLGQTLLLALIAAASVRAGQEGDFAYVSDGAQITITGYSGANDEVSIPAGIGGLPVTAIGDRAFYQGRFAGVTIPPGVTHIGIQAFSDCLSLTSVTIPSGVTNIGHSAFYQCIFLTGITLPESLITLGDHAFYCCGLTGVTIPDSVTRIGKGAFALNYSLEQIMIGRGVSHIGAGVFAYTALAAIAVAPANPSYCAPGGVLYDKAQTMLLAFPPMKSGAYDIPEGVTAIGESAFAACYGLTEVSMPETVATIGKSAFSGCSSLTCVTIPSGVTVIGDNAFTQSGLTGATIPDSVTAIGEAAFAYCYDLTSVVLGHGVTNIGRMSFYDCQALTDAAIGSHVTAIGAHAFAQCAMLDGLGLPAGLTILGDYAFAHCGSLSGVTLPDSVAAVGDYAFSECGLISVTIPARVSVIGAHAFSGCTGLADLFFLGDAPVCGVAPFQHVPGTAYRTSVSTGWPEDVPGEEEYWNGVPLRGWPIAGLSVEPAWIAIDTDDTVEASFAVNNTGLAQLPSSLDGTDFGRMGFTVASQAPWLRIVSGGCGTNSGVVRLRADADFFDTERVGIVTVASVSATNSQVAVTVRQRPFGWPLWIAATNGAITVKGLHHLDESGEIVIPEFIGGVPVTGIGDHAFADFTWLTSVTIPASVTNIGQSAFAGCRSLIDIALPEGIKRIGARLFSGCQTLGSVTIPHGVTNIGDAAFAYCASLNAMTIPDSVTNIGDEAFAYCTSLYDATIPDSVANIGREVFYGCEGLSVLSLGEGVTSIGDAAFYGCRRLQQLVIPDSVTRIGTEAFADCFGMWRVSVGRGVAFIGDAAFAGCGGLFDIIFLGDAPACGETSFQGVAGIAYRSFGTSGWPEDVPREEEYWNGLQVRVVGTACLSIHPANLLADPAGGTFSFAVTNTGTGTMSYWAEPYGVTWLRITDGISGTDSGQVELSMSENLTGMTRTCMVWVAADTATNSPLTFTVVQRWFGWPFRYTVGDGAATVIGLDADDTATDRIIPVSLGGVPVTAIGTGAFADCAELVNLIVPGGVTTIGAGAFAGCAGLASIFFRGDCPAYSDGAFGTGDAAVCRLPQASGWGDTFAGRPVTVWNAAVAPSSLARDAEGFGFTISGAANIPVAVESVGDLHTGVWRRVWSGRTAVGGAAIFHDGESSAKQRFYRVVWP